LRYHGFQLFKFQQFIVKFIQQLIVEQLFEFQQFIVKFIQFQLVELKLVFKFIELERRQLYLPAICRGYELQRKSVSAKRR
jgi:hypothetical protein